jgi:hypothetical protein
VHARLVPVVAVRWRTDVVDPVGVIVDGVRTLWRRLFPSPDGTVCGVLRLIRCADHRRLGWPCRCLHLVWHRGGHACEHAARGDNVRSKA